MGIGVVCGEVFAQVSFGQHRVEKPKLRVVLKGGGSLGFAHVGVLEVLERNHNPVEVVSGTSRSLIVRAAYCSTYPRRMASQSCCDIMTPSSLTLNS